MVEIIPYLALVLIYNSNRSLVVVKHYLNTEKKSVHHKLLCSAVNYKLKINK